MYAKPPITFAKDGTSIYDNDDPYRTLDERTISIIANTSVEDTNSHTALNLARAVRISGIIQPTSSIIILPSSIFDQVPEVLSTTTVAFT